MSLYTPLLEEGLQGVHTSLKSHEGAGEPAAHHEQDRKGTLIAHAVGCGEKAEVHCWRDQLWKKRMTGEDQVERKVERLA